MNLSENAVGVDRFVALAPPVIHITPPRGKDRRGNGMSEE
jgi:hypothetical protein